MNTTADMFERQASLLPELAELGMDLARDLAARAKAADSNTEAAELAHAFDRVSRSVRMCLALQQRLGHERTRAASDSREGLQQRLEHRRKQLKAALNRIIETETEGEQMWSLRSRLSERLEEELLFETFAEGPVEMHIARIRRDLGLPPEHPANDAGAETHESPMTWAGSG